MGTTIWPPLRAGELDQMRMAEQGARAQHDDGLARAQKRLGDPRQQFCRRAFDDDVGQRLEFADRHHRNAATEM